MILTALGIDSMEFDLKRQTELLRHLGILHGWLIDTGTGGYRRDDVCESAAILDKLVDRDVPLVQYRGLSFGPLMADAFLRGKAPFKYECESWTPNLDVAMDYVGKKALAGGVRIVSKKKHSKNEIILDLSGLIPVLKITVRELKKADKIGDLQREEIGPAGYTVFDMLLKNMQSLARTIKRLKESEYLVHPRPYTLKDVFRMRFDYGFEEYKPSETARLRSILAKTGRSIDEVIGKWLQFEKGKIVSVS